VGTASKVATALGETAVDFCFGSPVQTENEESFWPVFVLCGDGDVYHVDAEWRVHGPAEVLPSQAENYSDEACSILTVGGKAGPAVLAVARTSGTILHHVMFGDPGVSAVSLHLYQKVELDLGPLNSVATPFASPLLLLPDTSTSSRYLVLHSSGMHQVEVPITATDDVHDADLQCVVEHLICTRPTLTAAPAPLLGAAVTLPPPTILCITADHHLHALKSKPAAAAMSLHVSSLTDTTSGDTTGESATSYGIEERIHEIFTRDSYQPLMMSGSGTNISPTDTLELVLRATQTLKKEYMSRIIKAKQELAAEIKLLKGKKASQEGLLDRLETSRTELRAKAETISEKYEDVKDRSSELSGRVEAVLTRLQTRQPTASDAELKMARDLKALKLKMDQIKAATILLKEKEKYQRYQIEAASVEMRRSDLSSDQVENLRSVLQADSISITNLVQSVSAAKKEISL